MKYKSKESIVYLILCVFGTMGVVFGAIVANKLVCGSYINVMGFLKKTGLDLDITTISQTFPFKKFFSHYIGFVFIVWTTGFTAIAVYINNLVIFFRGFIYGYILSAFFIEYNFAGILIFIIGYTVPALVFLPILFRISYSSIRYSINKYNYFAILREKKRYNTISTYIKEFIVSLLGVFIVFAMQVYIINPIIQKIGLW